MSDALSFLQERNTHEVKLESGLIVKIELQQLAELLLAGDVPLPVIAKMERATNGEVPDLDAAALKQVREFNVLAAAGAIREVNHFPVAPEERRAVVLALSDEEFNEIVAYATRAKDPNLGEA